MKYKWNRKDFEDEKGNTPPAMHQILCKYIPKLTEATIHRGGGTSVTSEVIVDFADIDLTPEEENTLYEIMEKFKDWKNGGAPVEYIYEMDRDAVKEAVSDQLGSKILVCSLTPFNGRIVVETELTLEEKNALNALIRDPTFWFNKLKIRKE